MNGKNAKIRIVSKVEGNSKPLRIYTDGIVQFDEHTASVEYFEYSDDGEKNYTNNICISDNVVTLSRLEDNSILVFESGKSCNSVVTTLSGDVELSVFSHSVVAKHSKNKLSVRLRYSVAYEGGLSQHGFSLNANIV
ncbi:MAG: DUF1934 domain-containing protein [Clostridia bacterium]|nr:DUF1934 domain-containing protein [Clostridia bacterium]